MSDPHAEVLGAIQRDLVALYDLEDSPAVAPFLCEAADVAAAGGDPSRGEVLLVHDDGEHVDVGLYVAPAALELLATAGDLLAPGRFDAWCLAAEGVSHFCYLSFRHTGGDSVSQLELEIQAEVDKYAAALLAGGPELLAGYGVGLFLARSRDLRRRLFVEQELLDAPGSAEHDRYLHATSVAAEYTGGLERTFVRRGDREGLVRELRRYYRAGRTAKLGRR